MHSRFIIFISKLIKQTKISLVLVVYNEQGS